MPVVASIAGLSIAGFGRERPAFYDIVYGASGPTLLHAWPWGPGYMTKYGGPASPLNTTDPSVSFSPLGNALAVGSSSIVTAYVWRRGFGTRYSDVGLPGSSRKIAFSPNGAFVGATNITNGPYINVWPFTSASGFGTKYANPAPIPAGSASGVNFSPSVDAVAVAFTTDGNPASFVNVYAWSAGFGTKFADPTTLPAGNGFDVAFNNSGNAIAVAHGNSPSISAYPWSSGFGTKYSNPSSAIEGTGSGVKWSPNGSEIVITHFEGSRVSGYPWSSGFGTKFSNPVSGPGNSGLTVAFQSNGASVSVASAERPLRSWAWSSSGFGVYYSVTQLPSGHSTQSSTFGTS